MENFQDWNPLSITDEEAADFLPCCSMLFSSDSEPPPRDGEDSELLCKRVPNAPKKPDLRLQIPYFPPQNRIFCLICLIFLQKPDFARFFGFMKNTETMPTSARHRSHRRVGAGGGAAASSGARSRRGGPVALPLQQVAPLAQAHHLQ